MKCKLPRGANVEQRVKESAVANVHLRRLDLTLSEVLEPGLQLPDHEHAGQQVEVATDGGFVYSERPSQLGGVPNLTVIVRHHVPESVQRGGRNLDPHLRQIALQERLQEL